MPEFSLVPGRRTVIGMIHLQPLPGTPFHEEGAFREILDRAVASALALQRGGADGCLVQTVDRVYSADDVCDPARAVAIGLITDAVARATAERDGFHVGVQIMRNALSASLAVAKVAGGSFIRAGALVGQTLTPHGMVTAAPLAVAEYRRRINAQGVGIVADVDSMHFRWYGGGKTTGEVARAARTMGADAVAVGDPDEARTHEMVASVRRSAPGLPVILAGHTDHDNAERLLADADGAFVGTCLEDGGWGGRIDEDRVRAYVDVVRSLEKR
ncbi:BtpA/SgcQ family protein [Streptomyces echinoruber]|uniref:Phosphorybosylanthranilate isomerase n=1 Tax=Streptomyces echinoruber TaxID=68898 RepID=A0A918QUE0_9ACTN|nr:BtpA/SgcQ family protein [Streptomyces echinoruber]GGZ70917.1 phosphorybosylanthranilate isomerase [Streptomyces echinoruber]